MSQDPTARDARLVAEMEADVGVEHVADVYAEAFLGAAESAGQTETLLAELDSLVTDVLDRFPKLEEVLASARISHAEKVGLLDRTLGSHASAVLLNFLKVVSRHGRLDCLRAVHHQAHELYDRMRGRVRVQLTTAAPVDAGLVARITQNLRAVLDGEPVVQQITDPDLIGGIVVRVGDTVYDGSIATQLENTRQQMIDRSAHEIQTRRDRFRNPAGD
ncbi:MAG TPA: ATP synthase F1 subunit delta [Thermoguttaceae bacterium]|nr:ATP synthase F1 subunit delta [Thermoguttaceae bacterium]